MASVIQLEVEMPTFEASTKLQKQIKSVYRNAGETLARCIRNWMRMLNQTRHSKSAAMGLKPSNHFSPDKVLEPIVTDDGADVPIAIPGISRAFHDIDIFPKEASALAIPLHADAYGMSPREVNDRGLFKMFRINRAGTNQKGNVLYRNNDGVLEAMYALTQHVHQSQDRSLMPSDADMEKAAVDGAESAIRAIIR